MSEDKITMQTPAAVLAPKQQYLNLMMNSLYKFSEICAAVEASDSVTYKRVEMLAKLFVGYIPNPGERERIKKLREDRVTVLQERLKKKEITSSEYNDLLFEMNCDLVGEIMSLMDEILAVVDRQEIISTEASELEKVYYSEGFPETEEA